MSKTLRLFTAFSIVPQILVVNMLAKHPDFVEQYYSSALYPKISSTLRLLYGWVPFSVGDLLYITAIGYGLWWFFAHGKKLLKTPKKTIINLLTIVSIFYFLFHVFWGLNYYRLPLHKKQNLNPIYTTEQLIQTTRKIIELTNAVHIELAKDSSAQVTIPNDFDVLAKLSVKGYQNSAKTYPYLSHKNPSQKLSLLSIPLAYMGFSGYLNPLTNEAQVNSRNPVNSMPMTLAHEQAHQIGYAAENEANFIGFLSCINNEDHYFRYSGYTFALRYCLNELYRRSPETFETLKTQINPGILEDFKARQAHWAQYNNPLEPLFKHFYSGFLKVNAQEHGIESYSYVVGLIVGYFHKRS